MPKRPSKTALERAVKAQQLYAGAICANVRVAQKLYQKVTRSVAAIAKTTGMDAADVSDQVAREASKRGAICPLPGKDY